MQILYEIGTLAKFLYQKFDTFRLMHVILHGKDGQSGDKIDLTFISVMWNIVYLQNLLY